jgi:hypothetical protein
MARPRLLTADEKQTLRPQLSRLQQLVADGSGLVEAGWAWYEKKRGVVEWAIRNADSRQRSLVLLRDSSYLGDTYWPLYSSNSTFQTGFLDRRSTPLPLPERSVPDNAAPLGLVQFDRFEHTIACFVFTLSPGQAWAMLEGGYTQVAPPSLTGVYDVTVLSSGEFCVTYDPRAVRDWDDQTRTRLGAYTPNPSTFDTWLLQAENAAPYRKAFPGDSISMGRCAPQAQAVPLPGQAIETRDMFPPVFPDVLSPPLNP